MNSSWAEVDRTGADRADAAIWMKCLVPVLNSDLVLLGGGLAADAGRLLLDPAQRALAGALPLSSIIPAPPIRLATCGPAAGAIGATYLPGMISKSPTGVSA